MGSKIQNANLQFSKASFGKTINRNFCLFEVSKHYFMDIKVLHIDSNHSVLWDQLQQSGL
jgi:hypothetical protein